MVGQGQILAADGSNKIHREPHSLRGKYKEVMILIIRVIILIPRVFISWNKEDISVFLKVYGPLF